MSNMTVPQEVSQTASSAMRLLGRERLSCNYASNIKVRNTFIDIDDDEEDEWLPPMVAVKSEPVKSIPTSPLQAYLEGKGRWQQQMLPTYVEEQELDVVEERSHTVTVLPLEERQPEESVGSSLHATAQCKPCAWFWRPQGCFNGFDCSHCHLCLPGELKKLKRSRKERQRAAALESRSVMDSLEEMVTSAQGADLPDAPAPSPVLQPVAQMGVPLLPQAYVLEPAASVSGPSPHHADMYTSGSIAMPLFPPPR